MGDANKVDPSDGEIRMAQLHRVYDNGEKSPTPTMSGPARTSRSTGYELVDRPRSYSSIPRGGTASQHISDVIVNDC